MNRFVALLRKQGSTSAIVGTAETRGEGTTTDRKSAAVGVALPAIAVANFAFHGLISTRFPREPNEYYFLDLSRHLDWGYLDVGPLGPLLLHVGDLLGGGLFATRFLPSVAAGVTVLFSGLIARRLGGGLYAPLLAATAVAMISFFVSGWSSMSLFAFEPVFWSVAFYLVVVILKEDCYSLWPVLGLILGLGTLLKPTMLLFAGGLGVGLALGARAHLRRRELWLAAMVTLVVVAPFVSWMSRHDWVSLSFGASRKLPTPRFLTFIMPSVWMLPTTIPLWISGLYYFAHRPETSGLRAIAWAFGAQWIVVLAAHAKHYYMIPPHIVLLAAGAVVAERWKAAWLRRTLFASVTVTGLLWLPLGVPLLDLKTFDRYARYTMPPIGPLRTRVGEGMNNPRTMVYRRRFAWEETAEKVAQIYRGLSESERRDAVILARRYATAGALNFYGPRLELPRIISGDVQYWLWGPGPRRGDTGLLIGFSEEEIRRLYGDVQRIVQPLVTSPVEGDSLTVCVGRKPKVSIADAWPSLLSLGEVTQPNGVYAPIR